MKNIHDKGSKFKKEKLEPKSNHAMFIFPVISAKYLDVDRWTEMIDMLNNGYTMKKIEVLVELKNNLSQQHSSRNKCYLHYKKLN